MIIALVALTSPVFAAEPEPPASADAPEIVYHPRDVAVINSIIANNGLDAARGAPELWEFVRWTQERPRRITELDLSVSEDRETLTGPIDLSPLAELRAADLSGCAISSLKVISCDMLEALNVDGCANLRSINVAHNEELRFLSVREANLSALDVSKNAALRVLNCSGNPALTRLDVRSNAALEELRCEGCALSSLDISRCPELRLLVAFDNAITRVDTANCPRLRRLEWDGNEEEWRVFYLSKDGKKLYRARIDEVDAPDGKSK